MEGTNGTKTDKGVLWLTFDELILNPKESCRYVMQLPHANRCDFVRRSPDCMADKLDGESVHFLKVFSWIFCTFGEDVDLAGVAFVILSLMILFFISTVTADHFICPNLAVISETLHLEESLASATILSFGNGTPDLFTAFAAVDHADTETFFGGLTGAALFLTSFVAGVILFIRPFHVSPWPLVRSIICYASCYTILFVCFYYRTYELRHVIGILSIYIVYLILTISTAVLNCYINKSEKESGKENDTGGRRHGYHHSGLDDLEFFRQHSSLYSVKKKRSTMFLGLQTVQIMEKRRLLKKLGLRATPSVAAIGYHWTQYGPLWDEFIEELHLLDKTIWYSSSLFKQIFFVIKLPVLFILKFIIPVVDMETVNEGWCKLLVIINCLVLPCFSLFSFQVIHLDIYGLPVYLIGILIGIVFATTIFFTSRSKAPPVYHSVFSFVGFFGGIIMMRLLCAEVLIHLEAIGARFNLSRGFLASTLLAWGNCIGDLATNISLARHGMQNFGFSACFAGAMYNGSFGVGLISLYREFKGEATVPYYGLLGPVGSLFLAISVFSSLIFIPLMDFEGRRLFGVYLITIYLMYLLMAFLMEQAVIHPYFFGAAYFRS